LINEQPGSVGTFVDALPDRGKPLRPREANAHLRVTDVQKSLGRAQILKCVTLEAEEGRITGIIGPNGAGKSTLLNVIGGLLKPDGGEILLEDRDISFLAMRKRARLGMVRTFQLSRELGELTVLENLLAAPLDQAGEFLVNALFRRKRVKAQERLLANRAQELLRTVGLWTLADAPARTLSGGQKKLLELARALMLNPKIILLDEPAAGVSPPLRVEIANLIQGLRDQGTTFLIVEHDMDVVARLCDHVYVLSEGANLTSGSFHEVVSDERVIRAYLGGVA
jgi:ABC-type branched-subunit amino acid transport system ATPase component